MKDDYNLNELQKIKVRGLPFNIMPRYLYHYTDKEYEEFSLDLLESLVQEGSTAVDIGAHYGIYSLLASRRAKKVFAFEPVPENYEILEKNIKDNKLIDVITPINKAVSDSEGEVEFNVTWASDSAGFYEHPNAEVIRKISVQMNSVDGELQGVDNISFIKIDTEGHEIHVLNGLRQTLKRNPYAKLLIEFNPECLTNAGSSTRELIDKILSFGYDIFALHEETRYAVRVTQEVTDAEILMGRTYLNLLCLPKGTWYGPLFASHSSEIGGAELVLLETLEAIVASKETFVFPMVTLPGYGPLLERMKKLPVSITVIPAYAWVNNLEHPTISFQDVSICNGGALAETVKVFRDFKPQAAFTNTLAMPWTALTAKAFEIPHVWSLHEFGDLDHGFSFDYGYKTSLTFIDELSDRVIVNSDAVLRHVSKYISSKKLRKLTLHIKPPVLSATPPQPVFSSSATIKLVSSGLISSTKGQLEAVKAVHELRKEGHKAELMLLGRVGDKAYQKKINTYLKEAGIQKYVHIVGFQPNPFDYVNMADIFVMTSRNEALGRVTVEAMLLGKPVVGTDSGGTSELIDDGVNGLLYQPGDIEGLVGKIKQLRDKKQAQRMGEQARKVAEEKFHNNYAQEILQELVSLPKPETKPAMKLYRDLLLGISGRIEKDREEMKRLVENHQKDLQKFSDEYNKVYAAYNEVNERLEKIRNHPSIRLVTKVNRLKNKLRGRKNQ